MIIVVIIAKQEIFIPYLSETFEITSLNKFIIRHVTKNMGISADYFTKN